MATGNRGVFRGLVLRADRLAGITNATSRCRRAQPTRPASARVGGSPTPAFPSGIAGTHSRRPLLPESHFQTTPTTRLRSSDERQHRPDVGDTTRQRPSRRHLWPPPPLQGSHGATQSSAWCGRICRPIAPSASTLRPGDRKYRTPRVAVQLRAVRGSREAIARRWTRLIDRYVPGACFGVCPTRR